MRTFRLVKHGLNIAVDKEIFKSRFTDKTPIQVAKKIFNILCKSATCTTCNFSIKDVYNKKIYSYTGTIQNNTKLVSSLKKAGLIKKRVLQIDPALYDIKKKYINKTISAEKLSLFKTDRIQELLNERSLD